MAVTTDGVGNYFSGSIAEGVTNLIFAQDINSMLNTLEIAKGTFGAEHRAHAIRFTHPNETIAGTITAPTSMELGTIQNQARAAFWVCMLSGASASSVFLLNTAINDTEITIKGDASIATLTWGGNLIDHASSVKWGVATANSINMFHYRDNSNYLLISVGIVANPGVAYSFPNHYYGLYTGKHNGTKYQTYISVQGGSSVAIANQRGGVIGSSTSMNYNLVQNAGIMLCRRNDNNYAIGRYPNLVVIKNREGFAINKTVGLFNADNSSNILGSPENVYKLVGRLDSTVANDDAGYWIGMRIKKV
jgi:hypothetical protein